MTASILFKKRGAKIGVLQLDATISESHDYENEVSQWNTEDGQTIIDNIRLVPERISINGIVSNSPIKVFHEDITNIVSGNSNTSEANIVDREDTPTRVETAQNILLRIFGRVINGIEKKPEIITIVTGLRSYKNMAGVSLKINRDSKTGQALPFNAKFIRVSTSKITFIEAQPDFKDRAQTKVQKGKQGPSNANDQLSTRTSKLRQFYNLVTR